MNRNGGNGRQILPLCMNIESNIRQTCCHPPRETSTVCYKLGSKAEGGFEQFVLVRTKGYKTYSA